MIPSAFIEHLESYEYDLQRIGKVDGDLGRRLRDNDTGGRRCRRQCSRAEPTQKANAENHEEKRAVKLGNHLLLHP